uniref:Uncharacterized protein n=1 Tax=Neisseria meningitidis alpha275 TaxID=295996 RepID=C6SNE2_NEIME|nr:hypothetical protein predicted by Glimmer/Critica [Neisseria meningitidis alpha275]
MPDCPKPKGGGCLLQAHPNRVPVRCPSVPRLPPGKTADSVPPLKRLAVKLAIARIKKYSFRRYLSRQPASGAFRPGRHFMRRLVPKRPIKPPLARTFYILSNILLTKQQKIARMPSLSEA